MFSMARIAAQINVRSDKNSYRKHYLSTCRRVKRVEIAILVGGSKFYLCTEIHSPRVLFQKHRAYMHRQSASWKRIICAAIINTRDKT